MLKIPPQVYHFRRFVFELLGNAKYSRPGLYDLDDKLQPYLNFKKGFFIEVGANDGLRQSNTYFLEKFLGWKGVLVEGIPEQYVRCKQRRRKSYVFNYALVAADDTRTHVDMHYAGLMSVVDGGLKDQAAQDTHLQVGCDLQNLGSSYSVSVETRTLSAILDRIPHLPPIDFMSLDVEGVELQVLQGTNLAKYAPRYILVEARFFEEVDTFLRGYSYEMIAQLTEHDYLYLKR